jgi:hypothetical protein
MSSLDLHLAEYIKRYFLSLPKTEIIKRINYTLSSSQPPAYTTPYNKDENHTRSTHSSQIPPVTSKQHKTHPFILILLEFQLKRF